VPFTRGVKLLIDMNLSPLWVPFLSDAGFASVHWSSVGAHSAPDIEIIEYASENSWLMFTHNLDFGALLAAPALLISKPAHLSQWIRTATAFASCRSSYGYLTGHPE
jgi:predicted nuclease of predicted toxin-antitoxin system